MLAFTVCIALIGAEPTADFLKPGAKLEKLWDQGSFTEGGAWTGDALLFSDIGDRIMKYDLTTGKVTPWRDPSGRANGLIFDPQGRLIAAEGSNTGGLRRVSITDLNGTVRTLADRFEGKRFNSPNDVAVDKLGRVYVSDPRYVGNEPRDLDFEGVFRIDLDGSVHRLETTAQKPNGLVISPDNKTLYIADNGPARRALIAVNLDDQGHTSHPRILQDFGKGRGIDGMTITLDGKIIATAGQGDQAGVLILSPLGKILSLIPTPEAPANVEFGGKDRSTLYIMAGKSLYKIETALTGYTVWPK